MPKAVVEALGIKPADQLVYEIEAGPVVLRARTSRLVDLANEPPLKRPFTIAKSTRPSAQLMPNKACGLR